MERMKEQLLTVHLPWESMSEFAQQDCKGPIDPIVEFPKA